MFELVARLLLLSSAAGTVYWTADDAAQKKAADTNALHAQASELEETQASVAIADEHLKGNESILAIVQEQLDEVRKGVNSSLIQLGEHNETVGNATRDREAAAARLKESIAKAQEASADEKQAEVALKASEDNVSAKTAEMQKAAKSYTNAQAHLEDIITGNDPSEIPPAYADEKDKKKTLEAAQAELEAAETGRADKSKAVGEKVALVKRRGVEKQEAQKAFDDATAALADALKVQRKLEAKIAPVQLQIHRLSLTLENWKRTVSRLKSISAERHATLNSKQRQHEALQKTIASDSRCIESLQNTQGQVQHAAAAFNATREAYTVSRTDDLFQSVWGAKDALDKSVYESYLMQKRCAPQTLHIPPQKPPRACEKDTGGSCHILWCYSSRNAFCDQATSSCMCSPDACAVNGQCQSRGPPPAATLEEPAVPEQVPASGRLKTLVVASAVLIGATAAAVRRRSGSRSASLSESLLQ